MKSSFWKKSVALLSLAGVTMSFSVAYDMAVKDKERSYVYRTIAQMVETSEIDQETLITDTEQQVLESADIDSSVEVVETTPLERAREKIVALQAEHEVFSHDFSLYYAEILDDSFVEKSKEESFIVEKKSDLDIFTQRANQLNEKAIAISKELSEINSEESLDNEGLLESLNEMSLLSDRQIAISANMERIAKRIEDNSNIAEVVAEEEPNEEVITEVEEVVESEEVIAEVEEVVESEEVIAEVEEVVESEEVITEVEEVVVEGNENSLRMSSLERQVCEQKSLLEELKSSFDTSLSEIKDAIAEMSSPKKDEEKEAEEKEETDNTSVANNFSTLPGYNSPFAYFSYLQSLRDQQAQASSAPRDFSAQYMNSMYMMQMMQSMNQGGTVNQTNYYGDVFYAPMVPQFSNGFNNRTPSANGFNNWYDFSNPTDQVQIPLSPRGSGAQGTIAIQ